ncbi:zinc carboxypeptidase [candidate division KSB1 bacterium]|nr:zinc carboxypeptidase [candidate division KSB1 bacterium]
MKILKKILVGFVLLFSSLTLMNSICDGDDEPGDPDAGLYHTYDEVQSELDSLAAAHESIADFTSIGKSLQGRDLWAIKISDNVQSDEDEKVGVLLGAHHAREWISVEVPLKIACYLLDNYDAQAQIKNLIDQTEIWIVPMVNPDGHHYSVTSDRLWRKNRRNNGDGSYGVDLNRNYSYQWGGPGSSGDTFSETYRGPEPFSEPETRACRDFLTNIEPSALISYHSYSQLVLFPWGYTNSPAPDKTLMESLAKTMADKIKAVHGVTYTPDQASGLYLASGDTNDWLYALLRVPSYTIELRPRSSYPGFVLPESEIQPTFEENLPAALFLLEWMISLDTSSQ